MRESRFQSTRSSSTDGPTWSWVNSRRSSARAPAPRLLRCDEPGYDLAATALGLALANPLADNTGLNLARTLKPPVTIRRHLPLR